MTGVASAGDAVLFCTTATVTADFGRGWKAQMLENLEPYGVTPVLVSGCADGIVVVERLGGADGDAGTPIYDELVAS